MNKKERSSFEYMLSLLNKRDYSEYELKQKALQKSYSSEQTDEALQRLKALNYVNDQRLVENLFYFYSKIKGKNWIINKLKQKGIDYQIYSPLLENQIEIDFDTIYSRVKSKFSYLNLQNMDQKSYSKLYRFLSYQGFENSSVIISQIVKIDKNVN
ncbi:MAG: regulatory protein RecX [Patescibacteria group bacterium]